MGCKGSNTYEINVPFLGDIELRFNDTLNVPSKEAKSTNYNDKEGLGCAPDDECACPVADWRGATKDQTPHGVDPEVADVSTVNDKVTIVTFTDGTQEKAICREGDTFSIEAGVTIYIMKRMLRLMFEEFGNKSGTNLYNNMLREALKKKDVYKRQDYMYNDAHVYMERKKRLCDLVYAEAYKYGSAEITKGNKDPMVS